MQSNNKKLSVIIPTYNRLAWLQRVIEGLLSQTYQDFEVIVVDDGSTDRTESVIERLMKKMPRGLSYIRQENQGAGAARNAGVKQATGDLLLFIDDDVIPAANLLEEHVKGHQLYPGDNIAILGSVVNAPEVKDTHFMRWLMNKGPAFLQNRRQDWAKLDHWFFCTANISLSRGFMVEKGLFDEKFRPFFEDIELGFRLQQHGLEIILNKNAVGYHLRGETFRGWCDRCVLAGQSAALFDTKWPAAATLHALTADTGTLTKLKLLILVKRGMMWLLKYIVSWLDSHNYPALLSLYLWIPNYYFKAGYRQRLNVIAEE